MFGTAATQSVFLILGSTDMRKSIDTLALQLHTLKNVPNIFNGGLFVFCNRRKTIIKILYWDRNGFCLWQKRLDKTYFDWPKSEEQIKNMQIRELRWLLDGLKLDTISARGDFSPKLVC